MYLASPSSTRLALGPGKLILIFGRFITCGPARVSVDIGSSQKRCWSFVAWSGPAAYRQRTRETNLRGSELIAAKKAGAQTRRQHRPVAARADQKMQPAFGQIRLRIGARLHNGKYCIHYSLPEPMQRQSMVTGRVRRKLQSGCPNDPVQSRSSGHIIRLPELRQFER